MNNAVNFAKSSANIKPLALTLIDESWASATNSLIGRVVNFVAPNGNASHVEFIAPTRRNAAALVNIKWGGHLFAVRLTQPAVVPALDIVLRPDLPLSIWSMAVKEAISDWIELVSDVSGTPAVLVGLVRDSNPAPLNLSLGLRLSQIGQAYRGTIDITAADVAGWQWIINRLGAAPALLASVDPEVALSFCLRPVCVPISELCTLQPGDVVLLDESRAAANQLPLTCVSGGRIVHGLNAISDGIAIHLSNKPIKELNVALEQTVNPRPARTSPKAGDAATPDIPQGPDSLDELEMWLQFEVGHTKMSLGQVRSLTPGQVLVAAGDDSTHEVRVLCNGRWIATGRLVAIGERLGVQVTGLGGVDAAVGAANDQHSQATAPVASSSDLNGLQNGAVEQHEPTAERPDAGNQSSPQTVNQLGSQVGGQDQSVHAQALNNQLSSGNSAL